MPCMALNKQGVDIGAGFTVAKPCETKAPAANAHSQVEANHQQCCVYQQLGGDPIAGVLGQARSATIQCQPRPKRAIKAITPAHVNPLPVFATRRSQFQSAIQTTASHAMARTHADHHGDRRYKRRTAQHCHLQANNGQQNDRSTRHDVDSRQRLPGSVRAKQQSGRTIYREQTSTPKSPPASKRRAQRAT